MSATTGSHPKATLDERLWKVEHDLMQVARRQYALEAFVSELDRATQAKPFRIWNDILWTMVLDTRDMLVIHLASWTKGIYGRGGLLGQVKAHHLADLPTGRPATARTDRDPHLRAYSAASDQAFRAHPITRSGGSDQRPERSDERDDDQAAGLGLFSRERDAWRLYATGWVAPYVRRRLDAHREAYPVREPDLADLERYMWKLDAPYVRRGTSVGGTLIEAKGRSAIVIWEWLDGQLDASKLGR